jgi:ketosteroid isomerase-like protein
MHANERLVREFHEAHGRHYAGEDVDLHEMLTEDVVWHVPGRSSIAGHYRGIEQVLGYFSKRRDLARRTFRIHVHDVLANDERVVILAGGTAEIGGRSVAWETAGIFRIEAGRIAECWLLPFDQYAFDQIWS